MRSGMPGRRDGASLRQQILLPFLAGTALLALSASAAATYASRRAAEEALGHRAAGIERIFVASLAQRGRALRADASLLAELNGVSAAVEQRNRPGLARLVIPYAVQKKTDYTAVVGPAGRPLFANGRVVWRTLPAVRRLISDARFGIPTSTMAVSAGGELLLLAAGPVRARSGIVGAVLVAETIKPQVLREVPGVFGGALSLTARAPGGRTRDLLETRPPESTRAFGYPLDLDPAAGHAELTVRLPSTSLARAMRSAIVVTAVAGLLLIVLLIVLLRTLLDRAVLIPLGRVRAAITQVKQGEFDVDLPIRGARELRDLGDGFTRMARIVGEQQARLEQMAATDPLTGLANHRHFHDRLASEIARASREGTSLALLLIDLDQFKVLNDTHGHTFGDELLRVASERLRSVVRASDEVARMGGDEFGIILPGADADFAHAVAMRASQALVELGPSRVRLAASVGIALYPADAQDPSMLFQLADGSLYWAKRSGRAAIRRYDPEHVTTLSTNEQRAEVSALLESPSSIVPVFQPIVTLADGAVAGYEALARFPTPPRRAPDSWFAQARRVGLGPALEAKAIRAALSTRPPAQAFLCVNVSPYAIAEPAVQEALPADLAGLVLELTEHELAVAEDNLDAILLFLRGRGAAIAVDDAGAGYSGLQQVMRVRPQLIKLDLRLTQGVHADSTKAALIESLGYFAGKTGASLCAEGIEHLNDLRTLAALGVTYGQGYAIARPAPPWASPAIEAVAMCNAPRVRSATAEEPAREAEGAWPARQAAPRKVSSR